MSDDTQNRISDAISKFTNRGNNNEQFGNIFQNSPGELETETQATNPQQRSPSAQATNPSAQSLFDPGSVTDGVGSSTSSQFDTFRAIFSPLLQGFPDAQDRFDSSLDDIQDRVSNALERA